MGREERKKVGRNGGGVCGLVDLLFSFFFSFGVLVVVWRHAYA
jgi:hypothetical protein